MNKKSGSLLIFNLSLSKKIKIYQVKILQLIIRVKKNKQIVISNSFSQQEIKQKKNKKQMPLINNFNHCYSCGLQSQHLQRQQFPLCNEKSDSITIQKHWLCKKCKNAFISVKQFVNKFNIKWFDSEFSIQNIIDTKLLKFSHLESSFVKENKRKSELFSSTYSENNNQQQNSKQRISHTKLLEISLPNDIYSSIILDQIQKDDLHHMYWLPKTVLYLIQLTQKDKIRTQQRRQRVKKTLQALSYLYSVDQNDLKYLAVIIHTLYCFMDEQSLLKICDRLLKGVLQNSMPLELLFIEEVYQTDRLIQDKQSHLHKKPVDFRPDNLLHVLHSIFVLIDFFKDGKLHRHVSEIVHLSHEELLKARQADYESYRTIEKIFENYLKSNISQKSSKVSKISNTTYQQIAEVKRQRNHLDLIIRTIKRQQQENNEIVKQMQNKFKKQKDQYINKIVKLNNHIQKLELEIKTLKQNVLNGNANGLSGSRKGKNLFMGNDDDQVRSNPEIKIMTGNNNEEKSMKPQLATQRTTQVPISQTVNNEKQPSPIKKHKSFIEAPIQSNSQQKIQQDAANYLKSILQITDIIAFNQKSLKKSKKQPISFPLPQIPSTLKQLSQLIIAEITQLQKSVTFFASEDKKHKEQSTRLLVILKRKEQSWLPLLHEKDQIISLYEKALICLQKGFVLHQEPLSSRIQSIVEKVSTIQFIRLEPEDDLSIRDTNSIISNSIIDQMGDYIMQPENLSQKMSLSEKNTPAKKQKQKKARNAATTQKPAEVNKIKKKVKKQSQCEIF